ncbi:hypothetical protein SDC9_132615 [bioreactor metagenome]|uniref:Uncharacterized protein n=1 Tax=bioreactor metagenome TaxID=1076179 RepID=A0A645D860_9ZZZZ
MINAIYIAQYVLSVPDYYPVDGALIHELVHVLMFRNSDSRFNYTENMAYFMEGMACFYEYYVQYNFFNKIFGENVKNCLLSSNDLNDMIEADSEKFVKSATYKEMHTLENEYPYIVGFRLFTYLFQTYGKSIFNEILVGEKSLDYNSGANQCDMFTEMMKQKTSSTLFNDFSDWHHKNRASFYSGTVMIDGKPTSLYLRVSDMKDIYGCPITKEVDYYHKYNSVGYVMNLKLKMSSDELVIDFKNAMAFVQKFGLKIRGLSFNKYHLNAFKSMNLTFELYDAYDNLIYKGPSDRYFGGITEANGFDNNPIFIAYGVVKMIIRGAPESEIIIDTYNYFPELLVGQD